jgi:hypothetical protein
MDNTKITKRLTRDTGYRPPETTYQSTLTPEEIAKKLVDYERVSKDDIFKIPIGTHIRYFSKNPKTGEKQFRMGGNLTKFGDNNEYLVCSNGNFSWSVQLEGTTIFKKLTIQEVKDKAKREVLDKKDDNKNDMAKILQENKELKQMLKAIRDTTKEEKEKNKNKKK